MIYRFCQLNEGKVDFQEFRTRLDLHSEPFFSVVFSSSVLFNRIKQHQPSPSIAAAPCRTRGCKWPLQLIFKIPAEGVGGSLSPEQLSQLSSSARLPRDTAGRSRRLGSLAEGSRWDSSWTGKSKWSWIAALGMEFPKRWLKARGERSREEKTEVKKKKAKRCERTLRGQAELCQQDGALGGCGGLGAVQSPQLHSGNICQHHGSGVHQQSAS